MRVLATLIATAFLATIVAAPAVYIIGRLAWQTFEVMK